METNIFIGLDPDGSGAHRVRRARSLLLCECATASAASGSLRSGARSRIRLGKRILGLARTRLRLGAGLLDPATRRLLLPPWLLAVRRARGIRPRTAVRVKTSLVPVPSTGDPANGHRCTGRANRPDPFVNAAASGRIYLPIAGANWIRDRNRVPPSTLRLDVVTAKR